MKVLLVQPGSMHSLGLRGLAQPEPLGLECVGGALKDAHDCRLVDLRVEDTLHENLRRFQPDVVAVCCSFTTDTYACLEIAEAAKAWDPAAFVVVGGHHANQNPEDFSHSCVDVVGMAEGEITARRLLDALARREDIHQVPGLNINTERGQIHTGEQPLVRPLDDVAFPDRSLVRDYRAYHFGISKPTASIETTRGCPFRCNFCSVWEFYAGKVRFKSPERIVAEIEQLKDIPAIFFTDDLFFINLERSKKIAQAIIDAGVQRRFIAQIRSDSVIKDLDNIKLWKEAGLQTVFIGFESIDTRRLDELNKHNTQVNNDRALQILNDMGIYVCGSFIVDPSFAEEDFALLRDYLRSRRINYPSFSVLTPLPGTQLHREKRAELTTHDYRMYDLFHAVLPTRLPLEEFYREFASLYRTAYPRRVKFSWEGTGKVLRSMFKGNIRYMFNMVKMVRSITDPEFYLESHRRFGPPLESEAPAPPHRAAV